MALLSSLSLALLKDKKAKGKAPAVPVFGNEVKSSSARTSAQRSVGDHERPGLGALSRCAPASIAANGDARAGGVIVASPVTFPRTSSASSSSPAPVAPPPRPPSPQRSKSQASSQQSPSAGSAAAVGSFLAAYSDSDDEDDDEESSKLAKSTPPKHNDSTLQPRQDGQTNGKTAMSISSSCAMVEEKLDDNFYDDEDLDGEGLTTAELMPIAHLCGTGAWRWSAADKRISSRGPRLGSHDWTIDSAKAEEDPDLEDFAFLSEIASIEKDLAVELGAEKLDVPPPPESAPPPEPTDNEEAPPLPQEPPEEEARPPPPSDSPIKGKAGLAPEAQAPSIGQNNPTELTAAENSQSELSAGRRIAEMLRQADEPYRREQERRREEEQRRRQAEEEEERRRIEERRREREEDRRRAEKRRGKEDDRHVKRPKEEDRKIGQIDEATRRREEKMRRVENERRQIEEQRKQKEDADRRAAQLETQKKKAQEDWVNKCADSTRSDNAPAKRTKSISFGTLSSTLATNASQNASANASLIANAIANANTRASASLGRADTKEGAAGNLAQEQSSGSTLQPPTTLSALLRQTGPEPKHENKDVVAVGWLPAGHKCGLCNKGVLRNGGVFCGRRRSDDSLAGCFAGVCWKCMSKAPCETFGNIRTTKSEFSSLGADAWWMHEGCMSAADLADYNCEDEEPEVKAENSKREQDSARKNSREKLTKTFAWE